MMRSKTTKEGREGMLGSKRKKMLRSGGRIKKRKEGQRVS